MISSRTSVRTQWRIPSSCCRFRRMGIGTSCRSHPHPAVGYLFTKRDCQHANGELAARSAHWDKDLRQVVRRIVEGGNRRPRLPAQPRMLVGSSDEDFPDGASRGVSPQAPERPREGAAPRARAAARSTAGPTGRPWTAWASGRARWMRSLPLTVSMPVSKAISCAGQAARLLRGSSRLLGVLSFHGLIWSASSRTPQAAARAEHALPEIWGYPLCLVGSAAVRCIGCDIAMAKLLRRLAAERFTARQVFSVCR